MSEFFPAIKMTLGAGIWCSQTETWTIHLRSNLTEMEIEEWATLSSNLQPFSALDRDESWCWNLEKQLIFNKVYLYLLSVPLIQTQTQPYICMVWLVPQKR